MKKAILLDRDGTIIEDKIYLNDPDQIVYLPNVFEALRKLRDQGFVFAIATNQSGVARGIVQIRKLDEIHRRIREEFSRHGIDFLKFYSAPFMTNTNHPLRKPNPGMLQEAALEFGIDLNKSWMIGDRMTNVEAGHQAGCQCVLLGRSENPAESEFQAPEIQADNLLTAADEICRRISK